MGVRRALAVIAFPVWLAGCGDTGREPPTIEVADSAGVSIVVSHGPAWGPGEGWTVSDEPLLEIGVVSGEEAYQLDGVLGAVRLDDGRIAVLNGGDGQLRFYDGRGRFIEAVGGLGEGPGELERPVTLLRLPGDTLLVPMLSNWAATWFTSRGRLVRVERLDRAGQGAVVDSIWGCPFAPDLLPDGTLLVCAGTGPERNQHPAAPRVAHHLVRVPYDGSWADTLGALYGPALNLNLGGRGTFVAAGGDPLRIYVGDAAFFEIDVFEGRRGRMSSLRYPDALRPVGPAEREAYEAYLREWRAALPPGARTPPGEPVYAATLPGFSDLHLDREGHLWTVEYAPPWEEPRSGLVFAPDGRLLGSVELPPGLEISEIGADYVLGVWRDDLDVEYVRMYELTRG